MPEPPNDRIAVDAEALKIKLHDPEIWVRQVALAELLKPSVDAAPALPVIAACLDDPSPVVRELAIVVLGQIGEPAVLALTRALAEDQAVGIRIAAASGLARIGSGAVPAIEALCRCLRDSDNLLRWQASFTLGKIGKEAVPWLRRLVNLPDPLVCEAAINALGWIGPEAIDALPDVEHKAAAPRPMLQLAACSAIARISGDPSKALPVLISMLEGPDPVLHKAALDRIGELRANALPSVSQVLACLQDQMSEIRAHATLTLARMEANSAEVVAALMRLLDDPEAGVREHAGIALAALGPAANVALPALRTWCQNGQEPRMAAIARVAVDRIAP